MASTTDWKQLPDSIVDPITLEPINELAVEPFKINQHYFDGEALAAYLVASSTFENPLDRRALTRDDCQRLDAHLVRNKLKRLGVERERRAAQRRACAHLAKSSCCAGDMVVLSKCVGPCLPRLMIDGAAVVALSGRMRRV